MSEIPGSPADIRPVITTARPGSCCLWLDLALAAGCCSLRCVQAAIRCRRQAPRSRKAGNPPELLLPRPCSCRPITHGKLYRGAASRSCRQCCSSGNRILLPLAGAVLQRRLQFPRPPAARLCGSARRRLSMSRRQGPVWCLRTTARLQRQRSCRPRPVTGCQPRGLSILQRRSRKAPSSRLSSRRRSTLLVRAGSGHWSSATSTALTARAF